MGDGLPGPLEDGLRLALAFSVVPGATDGAGGVVGDSGVRDSPMLLGARLGTGGGGGNGIAML